MGLESAVVFAVPVVTPANQGPDRSGPIIHGHHRSLEVGGLFFRASGLLREVAFLGMFIIWFALQLGQQAVGGLLRRALEVRASSEVYVQSAAIDGVLADEPLEFAVDGIHRVILLGSKSIAGWQDYTRRPVLPH